jgi:type II secretory pathway predicted ATPase ExeA
VYQTFYGLRQKPFSLLPDPRFLYASRTHGIALNLLEYGVAEQTGFIVLTGEVGTGKTTLIRHLLNMVEDEVVVGLVPPTYPSLDDLMKSVLLAFDLEFRGMDHVEQHRVLVDSLIKRYAEGKRSILIIDEAQHLGVQALEHLRIFSNINTGTDHLLQFILVGQPELRTVLQRPDLRQFVQRISVDYDLEPLTRMDTANYIRHRLEVAGGSPHLFDHAACAAAHFFSKGIPRLINALCDLALVHGYADERSQIDIDVVIDAAIARSQGGLSAFETVPDELSRNQVKEQILGATV